MSFKLHPATQIYISKIIVVARHFNVSIKNKYFYCGMPLYCLQQ